ncbi:MAG: hypothetical protein R3C70_05120 [Geminicoccaceae bacterium]
MNHVPSLSGIKNNLFHAQITPQKSSPPGLLHRLPKKRNRCKSPGDQAFAAVTSWASGGISVAYGTWRGFQAEELEEGDVEFLAGFRAAEQVSRA